MAERKKYTLDELIAQCDSDAPMPPELVEWEQAEPVGLERIFLNDQGNDISHPGTG